MKKVPLVVVGMILSISIAAQEFVVSAGDNWEPFASAVMKVLTDAGLNAKICLVPGARSAAMIKTGFSNGEFFRADPFIDANADTVKKINVVLMNADVIAVSLDDPAIEVKSERDLQYYTVGYVRGEALSTELASIAKSSSAQSDLMEVLKMLKAKRFQVGIMSNLARHSVTKDTPIEGLKIHSPPMRITPMYIIVNASQEALVRRLTACFQKAVNSGEWDMAVENFFKGLNEKDKGVTY